MFIFVKPALEEVLPLHWAVGSFRFDHWRTIRQ